MERKFLNVVLVVFLLSVISAGCNLFGSDDSPATSATGDTTYIVAASDQSEIEQELLNDEFFAEEMSDMLNEDETVMDATEMPLVAGCLDSYPSLVDTTLPTAEYHQRWRRERTGLTSVSRSLEYGRSGDTSCCTVTVNRNITGMLWVDTTRDGVKNPGSKPLADTISHQWYFEKSPGRRWHVVKMSPREVKLTDASKQKVYIDKIEMKMEKSGQIVFSVTPPIQMIAKADLPGFNRGDIVKVMATVRNISPVYNPSCLVFLHHFNAYGKTDRIKLFDDGTNGDACANDNIFTNTFYIRGPLVQHAVIDVLDSKCLQNQTEDDYNSNALGLPYKVFP